MNCFWNSMRSLINAILCLSLGLQAVWCLKDIFYCLKKLSLKSSSSSSQVHQLQLFRREMLHFVTVMQNYVANQVWIEFISFLSSPLYQLFLNRAPLFLSICLSVCPSLSTSLSPPPFLHLPLSIFGSGLVWKSPVRCRGVICSSVRP